MSDVHDQLTNEDSEFDSEFSCFCSSNRFVFFLWSMSGAVSTPQHTLDDSFPLDDIFPMEVGHLAVDA